MKPRSEYLLIIDGSSLLATSYYSSLPKAIRKEKDEERKNELYPRLLKKDAQGRYTNALESFFHTIFTILTFQRPTHLAICWDVSRHTFRKTLWPQYKSNRSVTPAPLSEQYETAYEICERLQIAQFRHQDFEADDFAGSLAIQLESQLPVRILTRDKDYFQLISRQTKIWYGMSDLEKVRAWRSQYEMPHGLPSRVVEVNPRVLEAEFGYSPSCVCMMKALFGDRSDNIPGVRGMGESRSITLARHYATPDELYEAIHAADSKRNRALLQRQWRGWGILRSPYTCLIRKGENGRPSAEEMARLCYTLGKMKTDIPLGEYCSKGGSAPFSKRTLRYAARYPFVDGVLDEYGIVLKVGSKRPFGLKGPRPSAKPLRKTKKAAGAQSAPASLETSGQAGKNARNASSKKRPVSSSPMAAGPASKQKPSKKAASSSRTRGKQNSERKHAVSKNRPKQAVSENQTSKTAALSQPAATVTNVTAKNTTASQNRRRSVRKNAPVKNETNTASRSVASASLPANQQKSLRQVSMQVQPADGKRGNDMQTAAKNRRRAAGRKKQTSKIKAQMQQAALSEYASHTSLPQNDHAAKPERSASSRQNDSSRPHNRSAAQNSRRASKRLSHAASSADRNTRPDPSGARAGKEKAAMCVQHSKTAGKEHPIQSDNPQSSRQPDSKKPSAASSKKASIRHKKMYSSKNSKTAQSPKSSSLLQAGL